MSERAPAFETEDLTVTLRSGSPILQDVSLSLEAGETLGVVGESGSGKTTFALSLLGYMRHGMQVAGGEVRVAGEQVRFDDESAVRGIRGRLVGLVPQDPSSNLNPSLRIGAAVRDVREAHASVASAEQVVREALERVGLPGTVEFTRRYPHQLSGGQQQRVLIAAALACEPPLMVFDEPTTALDVVTQARILEEISRLGRERQIAMVYVSHDLAVVAQVADRVAVMYAGHVVEEGPVADILSSPRHPYTRGLVASCPDHLSPRRLKGIPGVAVGLDSRPPGCPFSPRCPQVTERCVQQMPAAEAVKPGWTVRCFESERTPALAASAESGELARPTGATVLEVRDLEAVYKGQGRSFTAVKGVSFSVARGQCVALVGESGSGKTTIARVISGLHAPVGGEVVLAGTALAAHARDRTREQRQRCQIIFQNPYESLNPRHSVRTQIARPARILRRLSGREAAAEAEDLLERVRLPVRVADRFPAELSGGERQRVAIARALAAKPELLVCDEITSALDVSVQAAVIDLLGELQEELGLAMLFITHDLGVVAAIADRVVVLDKGETCEAGSVGEVFRSPSSQRTKDLLAAAPTVRGALEASGPRSGGPAEQRLDSTTVTSK